MDLNAVSQGQGLNANSFQNNRKIDKYVIRQRAPEIVIDKSFTVNPFTKEEMSKTLASNYIGSTCDENCVEFGFSKTNVGHNCPVDKIIIPKKDQVVPCVTTIPLEKNKINPPSYCKSSAEKILLYNSEPDTSYCEIVVIPDEDSNLREKTGTKSSDILLYINQKETMSHNPTEGNVFNNNEKSESNLKPDVNETTNDDSNSREPIEINTYNISTDNINSLAENMMDDNGKSEPEIELKPIEISGNDLVSVIKSPDTLLDKCPQEVTHMTSARNVLNNNEKSESNMKSEVSEVPDVNSHVTTGTKSSDMAILNEAHAEVLSEKSPAGSTLNNDNRNPQPHTEPEAMEISADVTDSRGKIGIKSSAKLGKWEPEVGELNMSKGEIKPKPSPTPSKVIVNKKTESLRSLMTYDADSDSDSAGEESNSEQENNMSGVIRREETREKRENEWREKQDDDDDDDDSCTSDSESDSSASTLSSDSESNSNNSDDSDEDSSSVIDASDDVITTETTVPSKKNEQGAVKKAINNSVLDYQEYLPPIPDLSKLNINAEVEFMQIGKVSAIIAELVTVEAFRGTPSFDLDSMLFIDVQGSKKPLGPIFDVLGPVSEPIYCVRFNSEAEIAKASIKQGMHVYAAPKSEEFSKYIFVKELIAIKGSDASWLNDQEQPEDLAEFSDDEKEREIRRAKKGGAIKRKLEDNSLERHRRYEKTMNQCNTLNTRVCKLIDAQQSLSKQIRTTPVDGQFEVFVPSGHSKVSECPPEFNPTVPPPGFGHASPYGHPTPHSHGQLHNSTGSPSYNSSNGTFLPQHFTSGPFHFGSPYANPPPAPHDLGPPPARWQRSDSFRRGRYSQRPGHCHLSDNYFTNNSRNLRGPGPSSQPF